MKHIKKLEVAVFTGIIGLALVGMFSLITVQAQQMDRLITGNTKRLIADDTSISDPSLTGTKGENKLKSAAIPGEDRAVRFYVPNDGPTNFTIKAYAATFTNVSNTEQLVLDSDPLPAEFFTIPTDDTNYFNGNKSYTAARGVTKIVPYRLSPSAFASNNVPDCFIAFTIKGSTTDGTNTTNYEGLSLLTVDGPGDGIQE